MWHWNLIVPYVWPFLLLWRHYPQMPLNFQRVIVTCVWKPSFRWFAEWQGLIVPSNDLLNDRDWSWHQMICWMTGIDRGIKWFAEWQGLIMASNDLLNDFDATINPCHSANHLMARSIPVIQQIIWCHDQSPSFSKSFDGTINPRHSANHWCHDQSLSFSIMNAPKKPNPQATGQLAMSRKRLFPSYKEMEAEKLFS